MAIFKCKMCSNYDGEWCGKDKILKTKRDPCYSCRECRIKLTDKMSFCPYKTVLPDWLVWVLTRMGFSIAIIMMVFMLFFTGFFTVAAISSLLEWSTPMATYALGSAIVCMFLTILCKSCAVWLHDNYF